MSGTVLRMLKNGCGFQRLYDGRDLLGLVPDNHNRALRAQRSAGAEHLLHQGTSSGAMQNLGEARLQTRAFSGREHNYRKIVSWHPINSAGGLVIRQVGNLRGVRKV